MWLAIAFGAGLMIGSALGVVMISALMLAREAEHTAPVTANWGLVRHPGMGLEL